MLIITGTGRSGTGTMARLFGGYHEFRVYYLLDKYFSRADPHSDPFDTVEKRITVMMDLHQGIDAKTFVDASNLYIHFIDVLHILYPTARFILTARHGKDFVRSASSRNWHIQNSFGTVPLRDDPYYKKWAEMSPVQRNAWIWVYRNKKALSGLKDVNNRQQMIVRIEDVHRDETLDAIESFSGIKLKERGLSLKRFNVNPSFSCPAKEAWTDVQNSEFNEIAGQMMKFFGYE
jgi:hypothetical protein